MAPTRKAVNSIDDSKKKTTTVTRKPPSPVKKEKIIKPRKLSSPRKYQQNVVEVFKFCTDDRMMGAQLLNVMGEAGFAFPVLKAIREGNLNKYPELGPDHFDVRCTETLILRESHDTNKALKDTPTSKYGHVAFVAFPNPDRYPTIETQTMEEFRDLIVKIFCSEEQKNAEKTFLPFSPTHIKIPNNAPPNSSIDKIFKDDSTHAIFETYHCPEEVNTPEEKYSYIRENDLWDIFTRKNNGEYSYYATRFVGFPVGQNYQD